jgi:hypothetical protein
MLGNQRKRELVNLWEFDMNVISNSVCSLDEIFYPARILNIQFCTLSKEEELYRLKNEVQTSVIL